MFRWFFKRTLPHDGAAAALETIATGIAPAVLDAATTAFDGAPATRRDRTLGDGVDVLTETIAEKVLHAWLQNRHQTLSPLTLNFRSLRVSQREALARMMAIALLAGSAAHAQISAPPRITDWLKTIGADPRTLEVLGLALVDPPPLSETLNDIEKLDVAVYAYVIGLVASDSGNLRSMRFLDYLEATLGLPTLIMRSAARRYRR